MASFSLFFGDATRVHNDFDLQLAMGSYNIAVRQLAFSRIFLRYYQPSIWLLSPLDDWWDDNKRNVVIIVINGPLSREFKTTIYIFLRGNYFSPFKIFKRSFSISYLSLCDPTKSADLKKNT